VHEKHFIRDHETASTVTRRDFLQGISGAAAAGLFARKTSRDFDVRDYGATGDGVTLDTSAIQRAIDSAASSGANARVLLRGGRRYLTGALTLKGGIDLHLADDAQLIASTDPKDYLQDGPAILMAEQTVGLKVSGTGHIDGQAMKFMTAYSEADERWEPKSFRPRIFSLKACRNLEISGISFGHAPQWGLYMLGCEQVLIDRIRIQNLLDVPNSDGIDSDRCRHVEIRNCDIVCADDAIVIKTSEHLDSYGASAHIVVKDCRVTTRDAGLKIGTETFGDISDVIFERCKVVSSGRGPTITHRHGGDISNIEFRDIEVVAEHHAARWWGWGEAISLSVRPRVHGEKVGRLQDIRIRNLTAHAENSVRIDGSQDNLIEDVLLDHVDITIDRWTKYPGAMFDNRPTAHGDQGLEPHATPAYSIRNAKNVVLNDCKAHWGTNRQDYFSYALEAENVVGLEMKGFRGEAAHPERDRAIKIV
jgi:polygalacturonase